MSTYGWIFVILAVLTSPIWIIAIYVEITLRLQWHRCPVCRGREAVILMPPALMDSVCDFHKMRLERILEKESEVLGEYPSIALD